MYVLALGAWMAHAYYYYPFLADDALISLRYSEHLLQGRGLTWNDGEYVEGYTNFLWVLAVALPGLLGMELVDAARLMGVLSAALILLCLCLRFQRFQGAPAGALLLACLLVAGSTPMAAWVVGGLENLLLAAWLACALVELADLLERPGRRQVAWAGVWLSLLTLTRADAPLLVAAFVLAVLVFSPAPWRARIGHACLLAGIPFAAFTGQTVFRLGYYGDWLPNTYYAKLAFTQSRFDAGCDYMWQLLSTLWPVLALLALYGVARPVKRRHVGALLLVALCWSAYVVVCGGDIFPAFRHGLVLFVLLAFAVLEIASAMKTRDMLLLALGIVCSAYLQAQHPENIRATDERWEWPCKTIAEAIGRHFAPMRPTMAVTAAGCLPYFSKLPAIDMYGLNDHFLARQRPEGFGQGTMGHELMNAEYILSRRPEMITFFIADGDYVDGQFAQSEAFHAQYRLYRFAVEGGDLMAHVWLRADVYEAMPAQESP
ncbi:MAG: hypothetical protein EBV03_05275 [Proteobacteria bacterium]|nr:hypothetical protein [Pseudomonadota bacterium]